MLKAFPVLAAVLVTFVLVAPTVSQAAAPYAPAEATAK